MFDCLILGAGPGGYVAAIRASQLGLKVALIEKETLGGTCLNWGCIPTKALLRAAEIVHLARNAKNFGISLSEPVIHFDEIIERSRRIASQLSQGIQGLLKKHKVQVIKGTARFKNASTLTILKEDGMEEEATAKNIIIATGAKARTLTEEHQRIWTSKNALQPPFQPKSLLIVGSGAIGIEFASFFHHMGTQVTVIEMQPRILPQEDHEISEEALKIFQKQGMNFHLNTSVKDILPSEKEVKVTLMSGETYTVDAVLVAIGVIGHTEDLGLEEIGVVTENNQIITNEWGQTTCKGVYAIGDIAGSPWLAHKASHEGILCIEKIAGLSPHPLNTNLIPGCTYSLPQVASVGLTEEKARTAGYDLKIGKFPFRANGKALVLGETDGFIKTIFDAITGELLGAHMIGAEVTEMIQGYVIGKTLETTEADLMHTIFPHPTLSEMMHEAVLDAYGKAIHF